MDVPQLKNQIDQSFQQISELEDQSTENCREVVSDLYSEFQILKKHRENQENIVFDLLKNAVDKIKKDIEDEKMQREEVQQTILQLLENACEKLTE